MLQVPDDLGQRIVQVAKLAVLMHLNAAALDETHDSDGGPRAEEPRQARPWMASRSRRQGARQNLRDGSRHGPGPVRNRPGPLLFRKGEAA
jgi:hypothetical protein